MPSGDAISSSDAIPNASTYRICLGLVLASLFWVVGCSTLFVSEDLAPSATLLKAAQASSEAVTIDIYWASLPVSSEWSDDSLWRFVQEDRLDEQLRSRLMQNGLRAGVVGGAPPEQIVRLLNPHGESSEEGTDALAMTLSSPTGVSRSTKQLRPGKSVTIQAAGVLDSAPLLLAKGDRLTGETFSDVQPIYDVRLEREKQGSYKLVITPELHYGEAKMRWNSDSQGMIVRGLATREKRIFSDLQIEVPLVVGEMLIATSLPEADSRLGYYFHQADSEIASKRKAIVIRLTQAPSKAFEMSDLGLNRSR